MLAKMVAAGLSPSFGGHNGQVCGKVIAVGGNDPCDPHVVVGPQLSSSTPIGRRPDLLVVVGGVAAHEKWGVTQQYIDVDEDL
jgi:hypothetical protein